MLDQKQYNDIKMLLSSIRKESIKLRSLFLSGEELNETKECFKRYDEKLQEAVSSTLLNMEIYLHDKWKELI